ncbi:hypothetical protein [Kribbella hippodromi]|uniref:hypothetical protein n=1 Tax=Kribbella hippodromi TaxID=434347 RepID=UPI0031DB4A9F
MRLVRVLAVAGAIVGVGLIVNLIVTFGSGGPGGVLRWLIPPGVALVVGMVLALLDAAAPVAPERGVAGVATGADGDHGAGGRGAGVRELDGREAGGPGIGGRGAGDREADVRGMDGRGAGGRGVGGRGAGGRGVGRFDVSVLVAVGVVVAGVGVGGFALSAGVEYVAGYLSGNESGEDRLVKPVSRTSSGITVTVENVTYTSHFTRVEVRLKNSGKQAVTVPVDGAALAAAGGAAGGTGGTGGAGGAGGTTLRADAGRSSWPGKIAVGGTAHGTITFKGKLPGSATSAVLTFKSGNTTFSVPGIAVTN